MKKIDHGLGAMGLIALAAVLACFLAITLPVIRSSPPAHTSDWLGFAGGVVGGVMTLVAAGIAWFAVQRQISAQVAIAEVQSSIQTYNLLRDHIRAADSDKHLTGEIDLKSAYAEAHFGTFARSGRTQRWQVDIVRDGLMKDLDALMIALAEFRLASENKASFPAGGQERNRVLLEAITYQGNIRKVIGELKLIAIRYPNETDHLSTGDEQKCRSYDLVRSSRVSVNPAAITKIISAPKSISSQRLLPIPENGLDSRFGIMPFSDQACRFESRLLKSAC